MNASQMDAASLISPSKPLSPKTRPTTSTAFRQAKELQTLAFTTAFEQGTTASARAQLMRAWSELEERKRILRMKPKPKDIDVDPRNHRPARGSVQAQLSDGPEPTPGKAPRPAQRVIDTT